MSETTASPRSPIFNPKLPRADHRRGEWVELDTGRVYVREMNARDSLFVLEHSQRQGGPGGLSLSLSHMQTWQIIVSCYDGEAMDAKRIFDITDIEVIQSLRAVEWRRLLDGIERVNALSDQEVTAIEDFTAPERDESLGISLPGVSNISTGSPERSGRLPVNSSLP